MLEVRNLAVSYGRHRALESVSVRVDKGEICVILGANGAGKSTLLKAIAGMVKPDAGAEITMNGRAIAGMKPHRIVEEGIALVPEGRGIFGELSVAENLQLGAFAARARKAERETLDLIYRLFPKLAERKRQMARTMSGGEQQMVAIGRALMSKPDILMLDEPSLGLSPILTKELFRSLKEVAASGVGILLVEQNAKQSLAIADRGYLVENGLVTGEGKASDLASDPAVVNAYLGGTGKEGKRTAPARGISIRLPSSIPLPIDLSAMRDALSGLASRASRIQSAFVRSLRRAGAIPSAFVGRYDPKAGTDPWEEAASMPNELIVSRKAGPRSVRVDVNSADLADRASARLARHVRSTRLSSPVPSAFVNAAKPAAVAEADNHIRQPANDDRPTTGKAPSRLDRPRAEGSQDPAAMARRASERLAEYVAARRKSAPVPSAFAGMPGDKDERQPTAEASRGRVTEAARAEPGSGPGRERGGSANPLELAQRATARLAEQVRARRASAPTPSAFAGLHLRPPARDDGEPQRMPNGSRSLIGHNSAGLDLGEDAPAAPAGPAPAPAISDLVARAAAIHTAHVAARRRKLTAFVIPAQPDTETDNSAPGRPAERTQGD